MSISSAGSGSGIDISGLIEDLLAAEGQAKTAKYDSEEAKTLAKITGFGTLNSALSELQTKISSLKDVGDFQNRKATSQDNEVFTVIADSSASQGNYSVEISQLAENHKVSSPDFANANAIVGTGNLKFTIGTVEHSFNITSDIQTLSGIKDKVNEVSGTTGISATIVNTDTGTRIMFAATEPGIDNIFTVSVVTDGDGNDTDNAGLSQLDSTYMTTTQSGLDSIVKIDGATITSSSNTIEDAIDGVTIDLLKTNVADAKSLTVSLDKASVRSNIEGFVDNYNAIVETISSLNKVDPDNTDNSGVLVGDSVLRSFDLQLRRVLTDSVDTVAGGISSLAEIGVTTDRNTGKLQLNASKLNTALDQNFDNVGLLFAKSDEGIAIKLDDLISRYIGASGIINSKTEGLNSSINLITEQREQLERNLQSMESRLLTQFIAMDTIIAQLQSTSSFLSQQLSNLPEPLSYKK
tara:strand:+ start:86689 stop:88086 length:1398 start_codon:yes stop_codon:yes gene_type:complete